MLYRCKNCGGNVVYDPKSGHMKCPHCDGTDTQDEIKGESLTMCPNCGAPLNPGEYQAAHRCAHCGIYLIVDERVEGTYTPHVILPFKIDKNQAVESLKESFGKRLFTPSDFMSASTLEKMEGMYVPFFLYNMDGHYHWTGHGKQIRTWRRGNTEYTETKTFYLERDMEVVFDHVPVDASLTMDDALMDLMEPFDYKALKEFQKKYMSGFYGERYSQTKAELEGRAKNKVEPVAESLMQQSLAGYSGLMAQTKDLQLRENEAQYALLPVWVYTYNYHGQSYNFFVNGQTGKVIGHSPFDKGKTFAYVAGWFGFIMLAGTFIRMIMEVL